jgi:YgiT-type zinc finger domain-containing protein
MPLNFSEPIPNFIPCNECQAGQMHRKFVTYYTWLSDELITIPDFPAWVCDVCGRCEYDGTALNQLNLLLNPNAGKPSPRRRTTRAKANIKPNQSHPSE